MRELQPEDGWMAMTANQEPEIAFDYALASLGAKILSTRQTHHISLLEARLLGITVYRGNSLESLEDAPLQPLVIPGRYVFLSIIFHRNIVKKCNSINWILKIAIQNVFYWTLYFVDLICSLWKESNYVIDILSINCASRSINQSNKQPMKEALSNEKKYGHNSMN